MNLQICTLGRPTKYCRLGLWESPSHLSFQWLQTEEELKCDLLSNSSSVEIRKTHLGWSPVPADAVTLFAWFHTAVMPGFLYQSPKPAGQFCYLFLSLLPLPHLPCLAFSKGTCWWGTRKDRPSIYCCISPADQRQINKREIPGHQKYPVVTSSHTRQSLHLSCNLYYSFFPIKRENKGKWWVMRN